MTYHYEDLSERWRRELNQTCPSSFHSTSHRKRHTMRARQIVESSKLLAALEEGVREELAGLMTVHKVSKGDVIWRGGDAKGYFAIVGSGFIKMSRSGGHGNEVTLEIMGPGQVFGLNGLLLGRACPLNATALTPGLYGYAPNAPILPAINSNSAFKDALLRRTMLRLHEKVDLLGRMSSGRVEERIVAVLFTLVDSYGRKESDRVVIEVPLARQQLAELAATTTETTVRIMTKWQREGIVSTDSRTISILNMAALEGIFATG